MLTDFQGDYDGGHLRDKVCLFDSLKTRSSFVKGIIWKMTRELQESGPGQFSPKYFYLFAPCDPGYFLHIQDILTVTFCN